MLELGCASGDNLIPMALGLPNARFVGIDLSARQIEQGQRQISALRLTNIELRQYDIADVDASWGKFDYIISHGIYSWVPAPVREQLLAICRDNLAANGIAYVQLQHASGLAHARHDPRHDDLSHRGVPGAPPEGEAGSRAARFPGAERAGEHSYGMMLRQELGLDPQRAGRLSLP